MTRLWLWWHRRHGTGPILSGPFPSLSLRRGYGGVYHCECGATRVR